MEDINRVSSVIQVVMKTEDGRIFGTLRPTFLTFFVSRQESDGDLFIAASDSRKNGIAAGY